MRRLRVLVGTVIFGACGGGGGSLGEQTPCEVHVDHGDNGGVDVIERRAYEKKLLAEILSVSAADETVLGRTAFQRDARGNVVRQVRTDGDGKQIRAWESEYRDDDQLLVQKVLNADNEVTATSNYVYSETGRQSRVENRDAEGNLLSTRLTQVDDLGNVVRAEWQNADGNSEHVDVNEYDGERTLMFKRFRLPEEQLISQTQYFYEGSSLLRVERDGFDDSMVDGVPDETDRYEWSGGRLVRSTTEFGGEKTAYEFRYDCSENSEGPAL